MTPNFVMLNAMTLSRTLDAQNDNLGYKEHPT